MALAAPLRPVARIVRRNIPTLNFITLHYIYFVTTCLVFSAIFWGISTPEKSVGYTDSLFLVVSAMTLAGLNTVNLSTLNTMQQVMLFFLIIIGSAIFVSAFVVLVRKKTFERRFEYIAGLRHYRHDSEKGHIRSASRSRHVTETAARPLDGGIQPEPAVQDTTDVEPEHANATGDVVRSPTRQAYDTDILMSPSSSHETNFAGNHMSDSDELHERPRLANLGLSTPFGPPSEQDRTITYCNDAGHEIKVNQAASSKASTRVPEHITFGPETYFRKEKSELSPSRHSHHRFMSMQGVGARSNASIRRRPTNASGVSVDGNLEIPLESADRHLPFPSAGFVSRNSQFHHLSDKERDELGGCEYRAIQFLSWVVPAYFVLWQLLGCLGIGAYVASNKPSVARENGLNPWWVGSFNAVSAFNNSGMSLLDANMVAFQTSIYMLITMGLLILAGNTCYPVFLRLIVWTMLKLVPKAKQWDDFRETLQFLLEHPRRCYTNMFPSRHTWWLLSSVICLNGIDWAAFEILNLGNEAITSLPAGIEVLDGLFQALAVRSGGFYVVPIPTVRISLQVLYVIMMYISVYPVVITMRNSNIYEERSLGIYDDDPGYERPDRATKPGYFGRLRRTVTERPFEQSRSHFVQQQLRAQLSHDLWVIVIAVFIIMIIEGNNFAQNPATFSVFNVIFETVSGYGCVGISIGLPDQAYSFSGSWHKLSKLILCAVMIRGRHRGLPVAIDKAVLLPGEHLGEAEEEDGQIRLSRTVSRGRVV
ncbi:cation transport protein-domain-containing protein [Lophiotrema nucula]|uniref:Potassium transport protein n=1 Tax=Lophiotrema nucula TaxID=690887 RepID=A0A6A5Z163_9PLEO|nr:cation transport protein-domain-containing protein [Lophiotrema nucula]